MYQLKVLFGGCHLDFSLAAMSYSVPNSSIIFTSQRPSQRWITCSVICSLWQKLKGVALKSQNQLSIRRVKSAISIAILLANTCNLSLPNVYHNSASVVQVWQQFYGSCYRFLTAARKIAIIFYVTKHVLKDYKLSIQSSGKQFWENWCIGLWENYSVQ